MHKKNNQNGQLTIAIFIFGSNSTLDQSLAGNYALLQKKSNGQTFLNSPYQINFREDNSDKMVLRSSGYVGIGTDSPNRNLSIHGGTSSFLNLKTLSGNEFLIGADVNGGIISTMSNHDLQIRAGGNSTKMIVKSSGHIGIGTTSPDVKFEVRTDVNNSTTNLFYDNQGAKITNHDLTDGSYSSLKLETRSDHDGAFIRGINRGNNFVDFNIGKYVSSSGGASVNWITILNNGSVGIGTLTPQSKLAVNGQIRATEVKVLADISVPDYVFESDYKLRTLKETKEYISEHKHLPEIPSAAEIGENGIDLGDMNMRLLKKVEELTLHLIEQNERVEKLEKEVSILKNK